MVSAHKQHPSEPSRSIPESSHPDSGPAHYVQWTVEKGIVETVVRSAFTCKPVCVDTGKEFLESCGSQLVQRSGRVHSLDVATRESFLAIAECRFALQFFVFPELRFGDPTGRLYGCQFASESPSKHLKFF